MIDTSIQINNHNSYKATENFWQKPFGVELMEHITVAAAFYATSPQLEADRIRVIFYDDNGARLQVSDHGVAIGIVWERKSVTVAVPAGAKLAQVAFLSGNYWWAEAKAEEGQTATPYAVNAAGQLTYLTPNGIYTHTVQAKQIIVTDTESLEDKLVTINQNHIELKNNVNNKTTKLTSSGVYTGEIVAEQVTSGLLKSSNNASEINLTNGSFSFGNGAFTFSPLVGTVMGGWKTTPTEMEKDVTIQYGPFTQSDFDRITNILTSGYKPSAYDYEKYDVNGDGRLSNTDRTMISRMISGQDPNPLLVTETVKLGASGDAKNVIQVGKTKIGLQGVSTIGLMTNSIRSSTSDNIHIEDRITVPDIRIGGGLGRLLTASGDDLYWNGKKILTT